MTASRSPAPPAPLTVLNRYHQAMLDKSADDLADLYAVDAVHEFPFTTPGFPPLLAGREAVRAGYRAAWGASPFRVAGIRDVVVHGGAEPGTVIAEHVVEVEWAGGGSARIPGLLIIDVRNGLITRVRDYMDGLGLARAAGR